MSENSLIIISILATALVSISGYVFVSSRSDTDDRISTQEKLLASVIVTSNQMGELLSRHDERIKNVENKLNIRR